MAQSESDQRTRRGGQPIVVLNEDAERTSGRDAQQTNIAAGKAIAEAVRTTLGPQGMDKMLVSESGDVVITNDGATILDEMDVDHPAAEMLVDVAEAQREAVGDGTTTAAVLTGELLSTAEEFIDREIHPRTIVEGFQEVERVALESIDEQALAAEVDDDLLETVAASAMTGKGTGSLPVETLAETVVEAVSRVADEGEVPREAVRVEVRAGRSAGATELVDGVVADAEPVHGGMPTDLEDASVAVVDAALEQRETEADAEYTIESADQLSAAVEAEERTLREYAEALADAGVDVAFVTDDVADATAGHLASAGVLAFENVGSDEAETVAAATGASRVARVDDLADDDLGGAESISVERFDDDEVTFVEGGAATTAATILVRGGTDHVLSELERAVGDGVDAAVAVSNRGGVVPGAGATELAIARALRDEAAGIGGRTQLVVEAAADALEAVPRTLARNAGLDSIDALVELRAENEGGRAGLVTEDGDAVVADPVERGVVDPASVKRESVSSAVDVATMIVRIDDVISAQ